MTDLNSLEDHSHLELVSLNNLVFSAEKFQQIPIAAYVSTSQPIPFFRGQES